MGGMGILPMRPRGVSPLVLAKSEEFRGEFRRIPGTVYSFSATRINSVVILVAPHQTPVPPGRAGNHQDAERNLPHPARIIPWLYTHATSH